MNKKLEQYEAYNPETGKYDIYNELPKKVLEEIIDEIIEEQEEHNYWLNKEL